MTKVIDARLVAHQNTNVMQMTMYYIFLNQQMTMYLTIWKVNLSVSKVKDT
jgi:hypothetical protein